MDNKQSKGLDIKIEQIQELLPDRVKQLQQEQQQNAQLHELSQELKKEHMAWQSQLGTHHGKARAEDGRGQGRDAQHSVAA